MFPMPTLRISGRALLHVAIFILLKCTYDYIYIYIYKYSVK